MLKLRNYRINGFRNGASQIVVLGLFAALGVWTYGCGGTTGLSNQYLLSVSRLKSVNLGVLQYMSDFDDGLPLGGKWMDGIVPYTKDETLFHSPALRATEYGYALNDSLPGKYLPQFSTPSTVVSLFDSTDLLRNATDPLTTQPSPPRYGSRNTVAYLDGHVQDEQSSTSLPPSLYAQSQNRLKSLSLGMNLYSNDYDDTLPLANVWMDQLHSYLKSEVPFHSPAVELQNPALYGYALCVDICGQKTTSFSSLSTTLAIFDSTVLTRNATASTTTVPQPPRYGAKNTLAYLDGHVQP